MAQRHHRLNDAGPDFDALLRDAPAVLCCRGLGPGHPLTFISDASMRILGRTVEELTENPGAWAEAIHPLDRERALNALQLCTRAEDEQVISEYRFRGTDDSYRWIRERIHVSRAEDGSPVGITELMVEVRQNHLDDSVIRRTRGLHAIMQAFHSHFTLDDDPHSAFEEMLHGVMTLTGSAYAQISECRVDDSGREGLEVYTWVDENTENPLQPEAHRTLDAVLQQVIETGKPVMSPEPPPDGGANNATPPADAAPTGDVPVIDPH